MNKKLTNTLLLLGIVGLLLAYFFTVANLPQRLYTSGQQEYLSYNNSRSLIQNAPVLNFMGAAGAMEGAGLIAQMPDSESHVRTILTARYEEQQGLSVTVYDLEFEGQYRLFGSASSETSVEMVFPFPGNLDTLHDVQLLVDGEEPLDASYTTQGIRWQTTLLANDVRQVTIRYKANGANSFSYGIPRDQRIPIDIEIVVNGLTGSSIPKTSLPTTGHVAENGSEVFTWNYTGLIADRDIQLSLPARLSFAQRMALLQDDFRTLAGLAPFLVGLYVACLGGLLSLAGTPFRLDECLLSGVGLALFYPLLTFASGVLGVILASIISLLLVAGLQFLFLGLAIGWRQIWKPLGMLLLIFLVFFSLGTLLPWRGLLLSSGGLLLVAVFMLYYARRTVVPAPVAPISPVECPPEAEPEPLQAQASPGYAFCLHCGQVLEEAHKFCPTCGHNAETVQVCAHCNQRQYIPPEIPSVHCVHCGQLISG